MLLALLSLCWRSQYVEQKMRILIDLAAGLLLAGIVLGLEYPAAASAGHPAVGHGTLPPGSLPIYLDGELAAGFIPPMLCRR